MRPEIYLVGVTALKGKVSKPYGTSFRASCLLNLGGLKDN